MMDVGLRTGLSDWLVRRGSMMLSMILRPLSV